MAEPIRILHSADWQLGLKLAFIPGDRGAWARAERFEVVRRIAKVAHARRVDAVVVAGDVFDDNAVGDDVLQRARDALAELSPIPVLLLPGNHDAGTPDCVLRRLGAGAHVRPLLSTDPFVLPGVSFHPCPLMRRHEKDDPARHLTPRAAGDTVRIAIAHGALHDFSEGLESNNVIDWRIVLAKGFDYLALGDWHGLRSFDPRVWYSGTPEATRFKEKHPGSVLVVEIDGPGAAPRVEEVRVARTHWIERHEDVRDDAQVEEVARFFASLSDRSNVLVSLEVQGALSIGARTRLEQVLERESRELMHLRVDLRNLHDRPSEEDLRTLDAEGFVGRAASILRSGGDDASERALRMLHRFLVEERRG